MSTDTDTSASVPNRHRSFTVHHQSVFVTTEHEDEAQDDPENTETKTIDGAGLLALDDEPFETTLFHHGVNVDTRERASRIETGGSDEFVDNRSLSAIRAQNGEKTVPEDARSAHPRWGQSQRSLHVRGRPAPPTSGLSRTGRVSRTLSMNPLLLQSRR
jgi:hypothetical protein